MKRILTFLIMIAACAVADAQTSQQELQRKAEAGDADAMNSLGCIYETGEGVAKDIEKAVYWYKQAADKGESYGMFNLAFCYEKGNGVNMDLSQAAYYYEKAAELGNDVAMNNIGLCYYYGRGVQIDYKKALHWWGQGALKGNIKSMLNMGRCYHLGQGVKQDDVAALRLIEAFKKGEAGDKKEAQKMFFEVFPNLAVKKADPNNPPIIQIVPGSIVFADATGNNAIDANETCRVKFKVKNIGRGTAYDCVAKVKTSAAGVGANAKVIDEIKAGETHDVELNISSNASTADGTTDIAVSVDEPNGYGCDPTILTVPTKSYQTPLLKITDYAISSATGNTLKRMQPFDLQLILQNVKHGTAENVVVSVELPENVTMFGGSNNIRLDSFAGGKSKELNYSIIANNNYKASSIPVKVNIREKFGKYAESRTIDLAMNQQMSAQRIVIDEAGGSEEIEIARVKGNMQMSDIDKDIPQCNKENRNAFAVIIANENYQNEAEVEYALNDGHSFKTYCERVLGVPQKNIRMVENATLNNILGNVDWLKKVAESFEGKAEIIFYYAGHGIPDEKSKDAYLLPVDGYGSNTRTGYRLDELYRELNAYPTKQTLVFLDACFSGAQRSGEMMASARAVGIATKRTAPKGSMVVFSAAQGDETAYPYTEKQHGMFTYFLLKKLKETKGNVSLGDLSSYVITNVKQESVINNDKRQTPCVLPSPDMAGCWKDIEM